MSDDEVPTGWCNAHLRDVVRLNYGKNLPAKSRDNTGFPVYGSNGVVGHHSTPLTNGPTIIVGRKGSIGEVHLSDGPCSPIDTTYFIDEFHGQPPRFWEELVRWLKLQDLNRATALPGINREDAYGLQLPLPPLNEQRRIVAKLDALQARSRAAKASLDAVPPLLDKLRRSILAAAFRGDLTADWRRAHPDVEPATELLKRIRTERRRRWEAAELEKMRARGKAPKDDKWKAKYQEPAPVDTTGLPELPERWCWASLEELCHVSGGITKNAKRAKLPLSVPYLRVANVYAGHLELGEVKEIGVSPAEYSKTLLMPDDLLFVEGNGSPDQIGRVAKWTGEIDPCVHQNHLIRARPYAPECSDCLAYWFLSPSGREEIMTYASSTTGLHTLSLSKVIALKVPVPPQEEQTVLVTAVRALSASVDKLAEAAAASVACCARLDQSVLAKAFRGELVNQDPRDEPASALLDRIHSDFSKAHKEHTTQRETTNAAARRRREAFHDSGR